jgi:peptide/nickel transport system permease protein
VGNWGNAPGWHCDRRDDLRPAGDGRLTVEAILYRDYPSVQTSVMLISGTLVMLNLLVDLTYAWLDPRIHY